MLLLVITYLWNLETTTTKNKKENSENQNRKVVSRSMGQGAREIVRG